MRPQRTKEFEFRLGKLGLVLFVIGISFLLFLTFVMGVMVGVNMEGDPDQIAQGIPGILKQKVARSTSGGGGEAGKGEGGEGKTTEAADKGDFKLTFFDTLSKGKGPGTADATQPKAKKEESKRQDRAPEKERVVTAPAQAPAQAGKYVIQVASLQERAKAEALRDRLDTMGYAPYIDSAEVGGRGRWYRVKLKGFETREQAQKVAEGLQSKVKGLQCLVVPAGS